MALISPIFIPLGVNEEVKKARRSLMCGMFHFD
jgi:hypothetical protein